MSSTRVSDENAGGRNGVGAPYFQPPATVPQIQILDHSKQIELIRSGQAQLLSANSLLRFYHNLSDLLTCAAAVVAIVAIIDLLVGSHFIGAVAVTAEIVLLQ